MKKRELEQLIEEFALKQSARFNFDKLEKHISKKVKGFDSYDLLYDLTCESELLFDDSDNTEDYFMPRSCFFKGAEFLIKPLPEEVDDGFLVPGHRFMPFVCCNVFPAKITLKLPDGSSATMDQRSFAGQDVKKYLLFFGDFGMVDYLVNDDLSNEAGFVPPYEEPVNISVFDMHPFYKQCGFKSGDSLMLTVEDWLKGVFSVRPISAKGKKVDFAGSHDWSQALLDAYEVLRCMDDLRYDCCEQLARMFWLAENDEDSPSLITNPPLALSTFYNMQKELTIETMGQFSFFWPMDEPVENRILDLLDNAPPVPETELDAFFQLLGLSVNEGDAEAYMRDALSAGKNDPDVVLSRVISGRVLDFPTQEEHEEFMCLWRDLWDEVCEKYDPAKDTLREIRSVFLDLNDQALQVLRELDKNMTNPYDMFVKPEAMQLSEMSVMIHQMLVACNNIEVDASELVTLMPMPLDEMHRNLSESLKDISFALLDGAPSSALEAGDGPVYQLKITLKYSKPSIWRRVLVPAEMELEQFHHVIQTAFGWDNCHLHQFIDGRTFYQPGGGDDDFFSMMDVEDSDGLRICDLLRREKDKIVYEYDFGDSWEHTVLLEKVLDADPKQNLPICLKGKLAAPPEDCGGLYGYYQLVETLSGPDCAEKEELLEWCEGEIDPEAFDIALINKRLQARF